MLAGLVRCSSGGHFPRRVAPFPPLVGQFANGCVFKAQDQEPYSMPCCSVTANRSLWGNAVSRFIYLVHLLSPNERGAFRWRRPSSLKVVT